MNDRLARATPIDGYSAAIMNATPDRRIKTVLISTVHSPDDVRIFHREAVSLAEAGYAVAYICPGTKSEVRNGVRLIPIEKPKSRLARLASILTVVKLALREDAEVYHVHDPELILALAILRIVRPRAKLIYDAHENFRRYILWEAPLRPRFLRFPVAAMMIALEYFARFVCSAIVAPNASILENFGKCRTAEVSNFPSLAQLPDRAVVDAPRPRAKFAFAGLMCPDRRTHMMVQALDMIPESFEPTLVLAGYFREPEYEAYVRSLPGWRRVTFLGQISRPEVMDLYAHSTALIEMAEIIGNVVDSRPNKLFESLGCGTPAILAFQDAWRRFVEFPQTGWLLRDETAEGLARVMLEVVEFPEETRRRGVNARDMAEREFNWEREADKLIALYAGLLGGQERRPS